MKVSSKVRVLMWIDVILLALLHVLSLAFPSVVSITTLFPFLGLAILLNAILPGIVGSLLNFVMLNVCALCTSDIATKIVLFAIICIVLYQVANGKYDNDPSKVVNVTLAFLGLAIFTCLSYLIPAFSSHVFWGIANVCMIVGLIIAEVELWKEAYSETEPDEIVRGY